MASPTDAFDYLTLAIRHFYDAGSFSHLRVRWRFSPPS